MNKLIRITTVPISLDKLLEGQMSFLKNNYEIIAISSNDSQLKKIGVKENIRTFCVEMTRKITPIKDLKSIWKLYRFLRREKPLIVHSITPKAGLLSMISAKLAGVPIRIHTFTGLIFPTRKGILQKVLVSTDRLLCSCATHVYPEGKGVMQDLIDYGITNKPLKVLANGNINGIDINYFDPSLYNQNQKSELKTILGINDLDFVFIFVGRLVGDKGINELITAFESISNNNKQVKLILVGSQEPELDPLNQETIQTINNNKNIISVGFQSDVRPYFSISNCLAFPSYREGFPNVVMQAGAMGVASIVTNINGCNEIIIEGKNGTIIPSKNIEYLESKMTKFINDKTYVESLALNAREMIVSRYERNVVWNAILDEYKRIEKDYV